MGEPSRAEMVKTAGARKPLRVLLAPREINGQMRLMAQSLRDKGHHATSVNYYGGPNGAAQGCDLHLGIRSGQISFGRISKTMNFAVRSMLSYDVFHFFFGESLIPGYRDLPVLKRLGKKVFVHFRGSDIRQRKYLNGVMERRLLGLGEDDIPMSSPSQQRKIEVWRRHAGAMFVSIPEILQVVPDATLIPQVIDLASWHFVPECPGNTPGEIVIAHAASERAIKGTRYVIEAVEQLRNSGYPVRLQIIEGLPKQQVKALYKACHIGVDELLQGSYGNVAIELMAMGKPVVAYLGPWYREHRPDLPVVNATPADLCNALKPLIEDQMLRITLGHRGRQYVERWHEVGKVVDQLIEIYAN